MLNDIVVFTGPTLSSAEAKKILPACYLPPAKQGDIYRAYLKYSPKIIALIDGNFENVPAPWHKEILFAMAQGIHVYGSSSMGALRAAELNDYGMIGVGDIYKAYKSGKIEDDDEVALIHGPERLGYPALSEAMVNIRRTVEKAYYEEIISRRLYQAMLDKAKQLFYIERNYGALINYFSKMKEYEMEISAFGFWLVHNRVDQKQLDALALLAILRKAKEKNSPFVASYKFEKTLFWEKMCEQVEAEFT